MNFKKYHVSRNLCSVANWSNSTTDTRNNFQAEFQFLNGSTLVATSVKAVSSVGRYSLTTTTQSAFTRLRLKHNGATADIVIYSQSGNWSNGATFAISFDVIGYNPTVSGGISLEQIMLNTGSTPLPYEPYSSEAWHDIPHYIHNTATDTITTLPAVIYPNAATATVGLKGQTVQNGTPTPDNPIQPQETGERTENLFDDHNIITIAGLGDRYGVVLPPGTYSIYNGTNNIVYDGINDFANRHVACEAHSTATVTLYTDPGTTCGFLMSLNVASQGGVTIVSGSTPPSSHIPYGYKLDISSASTTTPIYLGEVESTRQIKKLVLTGTAVDGNIGATTQGVIYITPLLTLKNVNNAYCTHYEYVAQSQGSMMPNNSFTTIGGAGTSLWFKTEYTTVDDFKTYLQQQYAAGTPVTVWYVLATPETAVVNEPLRKIGEYADTLSNISIPVTAGGDTISVDTTLQPSEVSATYKGWHFVQSAHEKSRNLFDGTLLGGHFTNADFNRAGDESVYKSIKVFLPAGTYTFSWGKNVNVVRLIIDGNYNQPVYTDVSSHTITSTTDGYVGISFRDTTSSSTVWDVSTPIMLNTGSTALPYEPYWT